MTRNQSAEACRHSRPTDKRPGWRVPSLCLVFPLVAWMVWTGTVMVVKPHTTMAGDVGSWVQSSQQSQTNG